MKANYFVAESYSFILPGLMLCWLIATFICEVGRFLEEHVGRTVCIPLTETTDAGVCQGRIRSENVGSISDSVWVRQSVYRTERKDYKEIGGGRK